MTAFFVAAGALLALALACLVGPLARGRAAAVEARRALNVALFRDRLAELDAERERGALTADAHASLATELKLNLLEDAAADDAAGGSAAPKRVLAAVLALALAIGAVAIYRQLGGLDLVRLDGERALLEAADADADADRLAEWANGLASHLTRHPDDAKTWYLLGHARMRQARYAGAASAFETVARLTGEDPVVLAALAQARYLEDEGAISGATRAVMMRVLAQSPHEPNVREMLALDAFRRGAFTEATTHLESALAGGVAGARETALRHALERARAEAGSDGEPAPAAAAAAESPAPAGDVRIRARVTLAPGVEVPAAARVFVVVREAGGPPIPIAVRAFTPTQLPLDVSLSDADAMQPTRRLSQFERVEVLARLSRSGNAARGPDDLESEAVVVPRGHTEIIALGIGAPVRTAR